MYAVTYIHDNMFLSYAANDPTSSSDQSPTMHSRSQSFTNKNNDASSFQQKEEVTNYTKYVLIY